MGSFSDYVCQEGESYVCLFSKAIIGILVLKLTWTLINGITIYILAKPLGLTTNLKKMGAWAVVTGGTDGIGKGYAEELARLGLNVCIISRSQAKLDNVASEIESKYKVQVRTICADFSHGLEIYETITKRLKDLEIGVLVNNVGLSYQRASYFLEITDEFADELLKVNVTSMNKMIRIVLPQMVERKRGVIINISSGSGTFSVPLYAVYSASKAYVGFLSNNLYLEYKNMGVIIQTVYPYFVATNMTRFKSSWTVPTGNEFARSALNTVGVTSCTNGYWLHGLQAWAQSLVPNWLFAMLAEKTGKKMRAAALRKLQKMQ